MKKFTATTAMFLILCSASFAQAGNATAEGPNGTAIGITDTNTNVANGTGTAIAENDQEQSLDSVNVIKTPGPLPVAISHGIALPTVMPRGGNLITQTSVTAFMGNCESFSLKNFETMANAMEKSGAEKWKKVNGRIIPYPFIKESLPPLTESEPVWFVESGRIKALDSRRVTVVGGFVYDSEYKKNRPTLPMYYNARAYLDASAYGANVVVVYDQYLQGYAVSQSDGIDLAGVLSFISGAFTQGGSVAGNLAYANGANTEVGKTGAAYVFLHVEGFTADVCGNQSLVRVSPPVVQDKCDSTEILLRLEIALEKIKNCLTYGHNNLYWQHKAGVASFEAALCTKQEKHFTNAIEHFQMAELNYIHGADIKDYADSKTIIDDVKYWLASAYFARDHSVDGFLKAPETIRHLDRKSGEYRWVKTTEYEKTEIMKLRSTQERYSINPTLN